MMMIVKLLKSYKSFLDFLKIKKVQGRTVLIFPLRKESGLLFLKSWGADLLELF